MHLLLEAYYLVIALLSIRLERNYGIHNRCIFYSFITKMNNSRWLPFFLAVKQIKEGDLVLPAHPCALHFPNLSDESSTGVCEWIGVVGACEHLAGQK